MKGEDYGTRPEERPIKELIDFGAVVIDKPSGINPHKLCEKIKLIVGAKKQAIQARWIRMLLD